MVLKIDIVKLCQDFVEMVKLGWELGMWIDVYIVEYVFFIKELIDQGVGKMLKNVEVYIEG